MEGQVLNEVQKTLLERINSETRRGFFKKVCCFYVYGKTGTGKTTVVNQFVWKQKHTRRIIAMHFHDYLLDITKLLVKNSPKKIAKKISKKIDVLCFDEFFVESIVDAKILYDVFSYLISYGVAIVLTTNFKPEELYKDGFNRSVMFPKFSDFLNEKMEVFEVLGKDYRTDGGVLVQTCFKNLKEFENGFNVSVIFESRHFKVDDNHFVEIEGKFNGGVVVCYSKLFKKHSSVKDYRFLARKFSHLHVLKMAEFSQLNEDEAIRFRNFVDVCFARGVILTFDGVSGIDLFRKDMLENIKFMRCQSRLFEMQKEEYIFLQEKKFKRELTGFAFEFFQNL